MDSLFIAFPLSRLIKSQLERLCFGLPHVHWTEHSHFHLNFLSIGPTDGTLQLDIQELLTKIQMAPFSLSLQNVGCFRTKKAKGGLIWAGVSPSEELTSLIKTITTQLNPLLPNTKPMIPHVTLGRFGNLDEKRLFDYLDANSSFTTPPFFNDSFVLMKSQNTIDDRTLYQELARFKLTPPINKLRIIG